MAWAGTSTPSTKRCTDKPSAPSAGAAQVPLNTSVENPSKTVLAVGVRVNSRVRAAGVQENSTCAEVSVSPTTLNVMPV